MSYNCEVLEARGDVGSIDFVRDLFRLTSCPIAGIVQGAMVLRVSRNDMMMGGVDSILSNKFLIRTNHWR